MNIETFDSPYKIIASDVNNDLKVKSSDLLLIRKINYGIINSFPNNTAWRFLDKSYDFLSPNIPWEQEPYKVDILLTNDKIIDFIGVEIGDVNY
ncbi:MAG: hypothetical protein V3V14_04630 [Saprospiraceae bacterium]